MEAVKIASAPTTKKTLLCAVDTLTDFRCQFLDGALEKINH